MLEVDEHQILKLHIQVLKCLLIWPLKSLNKKQNLCIAYGIFFTTQCCGIPVWSAAGYQVMMAFSKIYYSLIYFSNVQNVQLV